MAIMTTLAIIGGCTLLIGGGAVAASWFATEDDRARARISEIDQEIQNCNVIINNFDSLKTKLQNGKSYLNDSKTKFKNGGHVLDGVPLASEDFKTCISRMESSIKSAEKLINDFNSTISYNNSEIRKEQAKLD